MNKVKDNKKIKHSSIYLNILNEDNNKTKEVTDIEELKDHLKVKKKVLLKAEPGAGKSTLLLQISDQILELDESLYPQYIDLSLWSGAESMFNELANRGPYGDVGLTAKNLHV